VYLRPTAPRSIGGVLDDAFRVYRESFATSWVLALCWHVFLAVPLIIIQLRIRGAPPGNPQAMLEMVKSPSTWLLYLVAMLVTLVFYNALLARIDAFVRSEIGSYGESLATGIRLLPRMLLLAILMLAALAAVAVVAAVVFAVLGAAGSTLVRIVVGTAFVVLGTFVWGRLFLANVAAVVEDAGALKSLGISWALIKDHWWRTATVYGVAVIIALVFYVVIGFFDGLIAAMLHDSAGTMVGVSQLISIAGGTVLMPYLTAVLLAIYYDLKLRKEGTDLAGRVNALPPR
jgi:hypothetical protein